MLVVLDTNVIVSSLLSPKGPPSEIIKRWEADEFDVATSPVLLSELERALTYPKVRKYLKKSQETIEALLERFAAITISADAQSFTLQVIKRDPPDNRVLECAKVAGAGYIITGDDDLLELKGYEGIIILNPTEFITMLKLQQEAQE